MKFSDVFPHSRTVDLDWIRDARCGVGPHPFAGGENGSVYEKTVWQRLTNDACLRVLPEMS